MIDPHPEYFFFLYGHIESGYKPIRSIQFHPADFLQCFWIDTILAEMAVLFRTVHDHDNQTKLKSTDIKMNRQNE